ncbi:MAG: uroporphyrinogen-III C-methyltransferase [Bacteroidetes bacterium]|nr:uroporphyrinogen-III C-methyltransferase [Bacteroidota bacterium]
MNIVSELILIGAGPGDPELITVKAWKAIQRADVILYDHLANPALLDLAPESCEKIYVGKEPYGPMTPQDQIHELIREKAAKGRTIVRLKGGDPFIFGRGFEEALFARRLGLAVSYIPGISSMQATGLSDIPLTHRSVSESIWVVTGTKKDGSLSEDLRLALKSKATVVIYMGMKKLAEIAGLYRSEGFGQMPAAIIQHASLPRERIAIGTAAALQEMAQQQGLSHPAIIVIGEVVGLSAAVTIKKEGYRTDCEYQPAATLGKAI